MTKPHSGHGHDHGPHSGHEHHERTGHEGHGGHAGHMGHCGHGGHGDHVAQFRRLFWVNLELAVPVVAFSPMFAMILGYSVPGWATWIAPVIGTVMYVWGGSPFLTDTVSEIKARKPGMMLLIALGITVAFLASWGATLGLLHHELEFWWELALLVVIMLLGHWIEMRSLAQTTSALDSLAALLPDEAERVEGETAVTVSPAELRVDDLVIVRPGGSVPADGMIVDGRAAMDESMITGKSHPETRSEGDAVTAGTVATDSGLRVRVTAIGDDTTLAGINRLVVSGAAHRRPGCRVAVLVRPRRSGHHRDRLDARGRPRCGRDAHHYRASDRLPARARLGDSARGFHRHRARGSRRGARERSFRARDDAPSRRGALRQDGHTHQGRTGCHRCRASRRC